MDREQAIKDWIKYYRDKAGKKNLSQLGLADDLINVIDALVNRTLYGGFLPERLQEDNFHRAD